MPAEAIKRKVAELNASNRKSLPAEWELMVAAAASRVAPLEYEPDLGGPRRGDLLVMPDGQGTPGCLVEIATISDEHAHSQNPYDKVQEAIHRAIRRLKCPLAGWHLQVAGRTEGMYGDANMKLQLGTGRPEDLLDRAFYDFLRAVKAAPTDARVHRWIGERLEVILTFDPKERGAGGGHLVYTVVHSLTRNPVVNMLDEKSRQLGKTGHKGPFGVVLCDGGCDVLSSRFASTSFSVRDILIRHFATDPRLSFVLILSVETRPPSPFGHHGFHQVLRAQPAMRPDAGNLARESLERLTTAAQALPTPVNSPPNAARCYRQKWDDFGWTFPGGSLTVSQNKIKLPARALLEMLAGRKSPEDFVAAYGHGRPNPANPFAKLAPGQLITRAELIKGQNDDDEIEFTFGPPDAAASRFRVLSDPLA